MALMKKIAGTLEGDVELWVFSDQGWDIPVFMQSVYMEGYSDTVAVRPCLVMPEEPVQILSTAMELRKVGSTKTFYVIERHRLQDVCKKAPGITPRLYFKFNGELVSDNPAAECAVKVSELPDPNTIAELPAVLAKLAGYAFSEDMARAVLLTLADAAPGIMVGERKPLNLGFCKLYAIPYRQTWKSQLSDDHPDAHKLKDMSEEKVSVWKENSGFSTVSIFNSELIESDQCQHGAIFTWNMEVEPAANWKAAAREQESKKLGVLGAVRYAERWCKIADEIKDTIFNLWQGWIAKAVAKGVKVMPGPGGMGQRFVVQGKRYRVIPRVARNSLERLIGAATVLSDASVEQRLQAPAKNLLALPAAEPKADDVRNPG